MCTITAVMLSLTFIVAVSAPSYALGIAVTGDWSETIDASDLQAGAGSNLKSTYESAADAGALTISGTSGDEDTWRVKVRRTESTNWHSNFILSVKRTNDGSGGGSISGGTEYQAISTTNVEFFSGAGDRGILLQLKLDGMSLGIPPGAYSTTIIYTVEDL